MKRIALTLLGAAMALVSQARQIESEDTVYRELRLPLTEADVKKPFFYFNEEWIPGARIDMITPEEILGLEIKDDAYGTRSVFVSLDPEVLARLRADALEAEKNLWVNRDPVCEFPGGNGKLVEWVNENIRIPESVTGSIRVVVSILVMPDGKVAEAKILRPSNNVEANEEALRLANCLPDFRVEYYTPKKVPLRFFFPITFTAPGTVMIR